jgi:hypothetical protein
VVQGGVCAPWQGGAIAAEPCNAIQRAPRRSSVHVTESCGEAVLSWRVSCHVNRPIPAWNCGPSLPRYHGRACLSERAAHGSVITRQPLPACQPLP